VTRVPFAAGGLCGLERGLRRVNPRGREAVAEEDRVGLAMVLGGPALYLLGEDLFQWRATGKTNPKRLTVTGLLILLVPLGGHVAVLALGVIVTALLGALAIWESRAPASAWVLLGRQQEVDEPDALFSRR
jgi:hypothetical protein